MRRVVSDRLNRFELEDGSASSASAETLVFRSHRSALAFFRGLRREATAMIALRELYANGAGSSAVAHRSDDEILDWLAWRAVQQRLSVRRLPLGRPVAPGVRASSAGPASSAPAAPPPPPRSPPSPAAPRRSEPARRAPAAPPPVEESGIAPDADMPAIAELLREAARDGIPFCEECRRRGLAA
jgi:hypothetical protein